jgi:hypothetical protein
MARRSLLVLLAVATFVVPSGFSPAAAGGSVEQSYERTDEVTAFDGYTCEIQSRPVRYSDGTVEVQTRASDPLGDPNTCFFGSTVHVRYTFTDADGDPRSGEAAARGLVNVTVPASGATGFRSFHSATFSDGTQTAEFPLPK